MYSSMMHEGCNLASRLEGDISKILSIEEQRALSLKATRHLSVNWRIRETSITDFIILSFVSLRSKLIEVEVTEERKSGSDIDFYIFTPHGDLAYSLQAKRALPKVTKTTSKICNGIYNELGHSVSGTPQYDLLINHATALGAKPYFLLYHSEEVIAACQTSGHKTMPPFLRGASILDANIVKARFDGKKVPRKETSTYMKRMKPFSSLFCFGDTSTPPISPPSEGRPGEEGAERTPEPSEMPPTDIEYWKEMSREMGCSARIIVHLD